jgi:hypothetical protein
MLRVLNLGAGVQSTTLYLWAVDKQLAIDVAIFADTGDEPKAVYLHLEFLKTLGGPEIVEVRACERSLGDNLKIGMNATGQTNMRHVSIPTFLDDGTGSPALGRRQCTSEYKIKPIERKIRELIGLSPGQQCREQRAEQIMGLSFDEPKRVAGVRGRFEGTRWSKPKFPLFDEFMTRADCVKYLEGRLPGYVVPRSACVYCPFHSDAEWMRIKECAEDWERACEIDDAIRDRTSVCNSHMRATQYIHRSCVPLRIAELNPRPPSKQGRIDFSTFDCEGMCGL